MNRNLVRGLFLVAISLAFGLQALRYPIGDFSRAGPGLFPAMVSGILLVIGAATVVRSFFVERVRLSINFRNIAIILGSLCGLALISTYVNMIAGIVFMVFFSALASSSGYSWVRNVKVSLGLVAMALALQKLLGLNLPLY
ncbi:tripartite tricarboxylate transporter TctB family protein [Variovorax sp. J31P207]|uniref:tripartite tricarboxylate transporter TctB family protein n=1 Tax=Variovorax sp. J31P207 TaxID=3053510 RepID=UPI0025772AE9|nr:tripartite tricarboxylate transporter TctB family protein [Variovorax sp. J31P207]MDM0071053.1 tripartite tricarboxylate transporter TctB family protein [Variovorax sp. J31P207]